MKIQRKKATWAQVVLALAVALLLLSAAPAPAGANSLPMQVVRGPAGTLVPGRETAVGVVEEHLSFDFGQISREGMRLNPDVTVEYVLENRSSDQVPPDQFGFRPPRGPDVALHIPAQSRSALGLFR